MGTVLMGRDEGISIPLRRGIVCVKAKQSGRVEKLWKSVLTGVQEVSKGIIENQNN